ncbi:hypothetical protein DFH07DRAFT_799314 [Mycena maculata]|uniref:Uncharacterized protein n=1 Tax=Mycena maculata TaxID=230809 RepID=A0AAD7K2L7_9AGAR|nr:hypothetical protein DFH07DRAFT_799314 [Mycena maculata]
MANLTTALLGSFSRIFSPSPSPSPSPAPAPDTRLGISTIQSDPDLASQRAAARTQLRPASSANTRPRPSSAIEGYWSWEGPHNGMILRRRAGCRDLGLKVSFPSSFLRPGEEADDAPQGLADVRITHPCQPQRIRNPSPVGACPSTPPAYAPAAPLETVPELDSDADLAAPIPDSYSSFDISLISDTSTTVDSESDTSFTLPPPAAPIGLGISGLFKADGSAFDGMGIVSFGCDSARQARPGRARREDTAGLSRTFLEEAAWTWAADPHHRMLTIIQEREEESEEEEPQVKRGAEKGPERSTKDTAVVKRKMSGTQPRPRDLSTATTISSELKRHTPRTKAQATVVSAPQSPSVAPGVRRATPAWRS